MSLRKSGSFSSKMKKDKQKISRKDSFCLKENKPDIQEVDRLVLSPCNSKPILVNQDYTLKDIQRTEIFKQALERLASADSINYEVLQDCFVSLENFIDASLCDISDNLMSELDRERTHLSLMQAQIDNLRNYLKHECVSIKKKLEIEKTKRCIVASEIRCSENLLVERLDRQAQELESLRIRVAGLENPGFFRGLRSLRKLLPWWSGPGPTVPILNIQDAKQSILTYSPRAALPLKDVNSISP